jgi:hypothetical protein
MPASASAAHVASRIADASSALKATRTRIQRAGGSAERFHVV